MSAAGMGGVNVTVRDAIKLLEDDGGYLVAPKGSHRQYKHPFKPGRVATGPTKQDTEERMREAVRMHLAGLEADGLPIPPPFACAEYGEV
jgi:predicted RNA binding protein YcfA (HicA-like mRNA interferase family)